MERASLILFLMLVFGAVFTLAQSVFVPTLSTSQLEMRRLRRRLATLAGKEQAAALQSPLLHARYRRQVSPLGRLLQWLPGVETLLDIIDHSGKSVSASWWLLAGSASALLGGGLGWWFSQDALITTTAALGALTLPLLYLKIEIDRRFARFEQQLPDALEGISRALHAGYPFTETLRMISREMDDPIASEFGVAFDEISMGIDTRAALQNLLARMPSLSLMAVVTTVQLQREIGGNLAETLENITGLIRRRFRFQRHVRTLTTETRYSAWIMGFMPFILFGVMSMVSPEFIRPLFDEPQGHRLIMMGLGMILLGAAWLRTLMTVEF